MFSVYSRSNLSCLFHYYYYPTTRVIVEKPFDPTLPVIYAMSPHGVFSFVQAMLSLVCEFFLGGNFYNLAANAVFYFPVYGTLLKVCVCVCYSSLLTISLLYPCCMIYV